MTLGRPENFIKMTKIGLHYEDMYGRQTVFAKINKKQHKHTCFSCSLEKFLHFSYKTVENFSSSKPRPPEQRNLGENPTPLGSENVRVAWGGWSGLELTDTLRRDRERLVIKVKVAPTPLTCYITLVVNLLSLQGKFMEVCM